MSLREIKIIDYYHTPHPIDCQSTVRHIETPRESTPIITELKHHPPNRPPVADCASI